MPLLVHPGPTILPDRSVRFRLSREAHTVRVAGNFTRWSAAPLSLHRNRAGSDWEGTSSPLANGVYLYKYIVDGQWLHDPAHPLVEPDGCGGWNSVVGLGGPSLGEPDQLRVASLNLHTYQESDALLKLEQIAFTLAAMNVDLVALQEVGEHLNDTSRPNAGEVIRTHLQALTGQPWAQAWRMAHLGFEVYREGITLLAPGELADVREHRLSQGRLARNALAGTVTFKGITLRLVTTHLTWGSGGGLPEMHVLLDSLRNEGTNGKTAILIAGDLNATEDEPQIRLPLEASYIDIGRQICGAEGPCPTATPQEWQGNAVRAVRGDGLASRIDYQLLRALPGTESLRPVGCVSIFNGQTAGDIYQPRVSDHIGILGIYAI